MAKSTEWSDPKKWVMGIVSALVVFAVIGLANHYFTQEESPALSEGPTRTSPSTEMSKDVEARLDFDEASVPADIGYIEADGYLKTRGIWVTDQTPGTKVVLVNASQHYGGLSFAAHSEPNVLTQVDCNGRDETFTLRFQQPMTRVDFVRPRLLVSTPAGVSHPAWSASALSESGNILSKVGEPLIKQFDHLKAAKSFTLQGGEIAAVRFYSDYRDNGTPFAAFCGVLVDDMVLSHP